MAKKTILLIRNNPPSAFGGAEIYQLNLAKILKKHHYNPIIVTACKKLRQAAKDQGIKTKPCPYLLNQNWSSWRNLLLPFYVLWQIILLFFYFGLIIITHPKALQIQSRDDMIAGTLAAKIFRKKLIWTDHADFRHLTWWNVDKKHKNPIGKFILRLANLPEKITTISDAEYYYINHLLAPRILPNLTVIKNGVPDELAHFSDIPKEPASLCYVGRITKEKGIIELIEAFSSIHPQFPQAKLHIYGDGPDLPIIKHLSLDLSNIIFHGHTEEPLKAITSAEIFVLPSHNEGLSLSLLEATMLKKTIIVSDLDPNLEVIKDGKNGFIFPVGDTEKLARAIKLALSDQKLAKTYAAAARKTYEKYYNLDDIVKNQIIPLY